MDETNTVINKEGDDDHNLIEDDVPLLSVGVVSNREQPQSMANNTILASDQAANIKDYMIWSCVNFWCFCWPFGIIALTLSSMVSQMKKGADVEGARCLSKSTAIWNAITTVTGIGLISAIIYYNYVSSPLKHY